MPNPAPRPRPPVPAEPRCPRAAGAVMLAATLAAAPLRGEDAPALRAGTAATDVTPWLGLSLNGHMSDRQANAVHDPLHARCLALEAGSTRVAIVVVDSCMVPDDVVERAKARAARRGGPPPEHVLVSATHSHSCPAAVGVFQTEPDPAYRAFLARRIGDAVALSSKRLAPARLAHGKGSVPGHVFNRRWFLREGKVPPDPFGGTDDRVRMNPPRGSGDLVEPAGPVDPSLHVVRVDRADGRPLALLAVYALHYVGGLPGGAASADYFGEFARIVERELAPATPPDDPFVALLANGASGDINNIDFTRSIPRREPFERIREVADDVAAEALRVARSLEPRGDVPLAARTATIEAGVRKPSPEEVAAARRVLEAAEGRPLRGLREVYARETVRLAGFPEREELVLQALRVGDLGLAGVPCEVFVEIGLEVRERSPLPSTTVVGLANGYHGYLPTPRHHELGGYETWRARSSRLEEDAGPGVVDVLARLLRDLSGASAPERSADGEDVEDGGASGAAGTPQEAESPEDPGDAAGSRDGRSGAAGTRGGPEAPEPPEGSGGGSGLSSGTARQHGVSRRP